MNKDTYSISIVIPVYNSEGSLKKLHDNITQKLPQITGDYEVIMVEDCSKDNSWEIVKQIVAKDSRVRGIRLSRNYGQHNALLCGIRAAKNSVIVTMDDDLQHPVEEIAKLLDKLNEGYDVVYGAPHKEQHGMLRNIASIITKMVLKSSMGIESARNVSAFRIFHTRLREAFKGYRSPTVSIDVLLTWATTKFTSIKVVHNQREIGPSNYTLYKLITHAFNMMTGFSTKPLQLASLIGFAFTLFGFAILIWVISQYIFYNSVVPGFPFLASIIAIFSGAQLFAIGVIGEYIARIHFRTLERPAYIIQDSLDNKINSQ